MGRYSKTPCKSTYAERINSIKSNRAVAMDKGIQDLKQDAIKASESLLDGTFDEKQGQLDFQKALAEWRGASHLETMSVNAQTGSTQTTFELPKSHDSLKELEKQVEKLLVESSSLSYMDKILLSKLKALSEEGFLIDDLNNVDSIMDEIPPSDLLNDFTTGQSNKTIPSHLIEVISIQELDNDDGFMGQVLDSNQIIIQEPM